MKGYFLTLNSKQYDIRIEKSPLLLAIRLLAVRPSWPGNKFLKNSKKVIMFFITLDYGRTIDIESLQNRLLKVCSVPTTSAGLPRLFCCGH